MIGNQPLSSSTSTTIVKSGRGGARPGTGRKKGSITRRLKTIRDLSMKAMKTAKRVPLETLLKNMNRFDDEADALYEKYRELMAGKPDGKSEKAIAKYMGDVMLAWSKTRECMLDAQRCAVDAAPFMHQKLSSVAVTVNDTTITRISDETAMSDDELADYYNNLRLRPTSVKPMEIVTLDNETGQQINEEED